MTERDSAIRPKGVEAKVTSTQNVVLTFDHGGIPPILLTAQGATQVGSLLNSQADIAEEQS